MKHDGFAGIDAQHRRQGVVPAEVALVLMERVDRVAVHGYVIEWLASSPVLIEYYSRSDEPRTSARRVGENRRERVGLVGDRQSRAGSCNAPSTGREVVEAASSGTHRSRRIFIAMRVTIAR